MQGCGEPLAGQPDPRPRQVNGVRVTVEDGALGARARVVEQAGTDGRRREPDVGIGMRTMFDALDRVLRENPEVGAYNQTI